MIAGAKRVIQNVHRSKVLLCDGLCGGARRAHGKMKRNLPYPGYLTPDGRYLCIPCWSNPKVLNDEQRAQARDHSGDSVARRAMALSTTLTITE